MRAIRETFNFAGRSRRAEAACYWVAAWLVDIVGIMAALMLLGDTAGGIVAVGLYFISGLPACALFARRMHDQNRSGWWALMLVIPVASSLNPASVNFTHTHGGFVPKTPGGPLGWGLDVASLALLVLTFWPGSTGPNRYGDDPRFAE
jgi:uncharacterized membrane protein YhaH (DUF805 family)